MENYNIYIRRVLKQVHPDSNISEEAKTNINLILNILLIKLVNQCSKLMKPVNFENAGKILHQKKTLSVLELETAVKLIIPDILGKTAISEGKKVVSRFKKNEEMKGTFAEKAGLQFSVSKTRNAMRNLLLKDDNLSKYAPVYAAAVLEYICAEILELAGNVARDQKRITINTLFMKISIINDQELEDLIMGILNISLSGEKGVIMNKKFKYAQPAIL